VSHKKRATLFSTVNLELFGVHTFQELAAGDVLQAIEERILRIFGEIILVDTISKRCFHVHIK